MDVTTRSSHWAVLASELTLLTVSLVAVLGLRRLFTSWELARTVIPVVIVTHLLMAIFRSRFGGAALGVASSLVATLYLTAAIGYGSTFSYLLPTGSTLDVVRDELRTAWNLYQDATAPVEPLSGYIVVIALAAWLVSVLAHLAAFWVRSPIEAVAPGFVVVIATGLLGHRTSDTAAITHTALYLSVAMAFVLAERISRTDAHSSWLAGHRRSGISHLLAGGLGAVLIAVLIGSLFGPNLPGARAAALLDVRHVGEGDGGGAGNRNPRNPLVDIQDRLVNQSADVVMRVQSDVRSYWRLLALDQFDGVGWSLNERFKPGGQELTAAGGLTDELDLVRQTFAIEALGEDWIPAAFAPTRISAGFDTLFEPQSATLLVADPDVELSGQTYRVESLIPATDAATVAARSDREVSADILTRYTELPDGFSAEVQRVAAEVTAAATTPFESAIVLQNWFRSEFTYDATVANGHDFRRIEDFLAARVGYCEQFATTFAAMARGLGIPSRVAVGFTWGDATSVDGEYIVRGRHSHAWPEIYLAGVGWTQFEPTPGRGNPAAADVNGVGEAQDDSPPGTDGPGATTPPATVPPNQGTTPPPGGDTPTEGSEGGFGTAAGRVLRTVAVLLAIAVVGLAAYAAGLTAFRHLRARAAERAATTPDQRVALAWRRTVDSLGSAGHRALRAETPLEYVGRVRRWLAADRERFDRLGELAAASIYGVPTRVDADTARQAESDAVVIDGHVRARRSQWDRLVALVDPRTPDRPRPSRSGVSPAS